MPNTVETWEKWQVGQLAKPAECISKDSSLYNALEHFKTTRSEILIVTENGNLREPILGIIRQIDLQSILPQNASPDLEQSQKLVSEEMMVSGEFPYLYHDEELIEALKIFTKPVSRTGLIESKYFASMLPVLDRDFKVWGTLSSFDFIVAMNDGFLPLPDLQVWQCVWDYGEGDSDWVVAYSDTPFNDVYAIMRIQSKRTIPVLVQDSKEILGIITDHVLFNTEYSKNEEEKEKLTAKDILIPIRENLFIMPGQSLRDAVSIFASYPYIGLLVVVENKERRQFKGYLGRTRILKELLKYA